MTAEPPPLPAPVYAPGKEAEIAALTDALMETIRHSFAALSPEKQGELLVEFAAVVSKSNTAVYTQTMNRIKNVAILSVASSLKDHSLNGEYGRIMQEQHEERRREAELLHLDDGEAETVHPLAASFGVLKDDPLWDEYEAALRKIKAEDQLG